MKMDDKMDAVCVAWLITASVIQLFADSLRLCFVDI